MQQGLAYWGYKNLFNNIGYTVILLVELGCAPYSHLIKFDLNTFTDFSIDGIHLNLIC